jgi:hypothetical protein
METFITVVALVAIAVLGALVVYRLNVLQGQRVAHFHGSHFVQGPYVPAPEKRRRKSRGRAASAGPGAHRVGK